MQTPRPFPSGRSLLAVGILLLAGCTPGSEKSLRKADAHYLNGAFDKAEIEYLNTLKADPGNARAVAQLGLIFADQGRSVEAFHLLSRTRERQPDNLEVRTKLARLNLGARAIPAARAELTYVLEHNPADPEAPQLLAECIQQPADLTEIRDFLQKLPTAGTAPVLVALANLEFRQHHLPEAEALLNRAREVDARFPAVHAALAILHQARNNPAAAETEAAATWELSGPRTPLKLLYPRYKLQAGDIAGARRLLNELVGQAPDSVPPLLLLAEIATKEKQTDEALGFTDKILERDRLNLSAQLLRIRLLLAKNEPDKALASADQMLKVQPKNPELHYLAALCHLAKQDSAKAFASLNQTVELAPDHTEAILLLADASLRKGDHQAVIASLQKVLAKKPDLLPAKMLLGRAYAARGNTTEALSLFRSVSAAAPKDATLLLPIVQILRFQKNYGEARQVLLRALELAPESITVAENLVDLDLIENHPDQARQRAEALLKQQPNQAAACLVLTKVELAAKNYPAAETLLLRTIELQPASNLAYQLLAALYSETKQEAKAIVQLEELAQREPRNVTLPMRIALLAERLQDYPRARTAYEKALALNPKFGPALNNLAYLLAERLNENDLALTYAQKARELAPLDPNVSDTLAWIYYKKGQFSSARNLLLESAAKVPDDPVTQYHLGAAHYMMGDLDAARTAFERALQLKPLLPEADDIRRRLANIALTGDAGSPATRAALEKTLATDKQDPVVLTLLASLHEQKGEFDQAEQNVQAALALNPQYVQATLVRIRTLLARGQVAPALELAKATRKQNPDDPAVGYQLGRLAFQSGDHVWAASLLKESARRLSDQPEILADYARAAYSIGRVDEAEETFQRLRTEFASSPVSADAGRYLELIALAREPNAAGAALVARGLEAQPVFVPALVAQAALAQRKQDLPAARQAYEKVLTLYPEFVPAKRELTLLAAASEQDDPAAYARASQARDALPRDAELTRAVGILACRRGDYSRAATLLRESQARLGENALGLYYLGVAQARLKDAAARNTLRRAVELGLPPPQAAEAGKLLTDLK